MTVYLVRDIESGMNIGIYTTQRKALMALCNYMEEKEIPLEEILNGSSCVMIPFELDKLYY